MCPSIFTHKDTGYQIKKAASTDAAFFITGS